jgi:hypothetical protein
MPFYVLRMFLNHPNLLTTEAFDVHVILTTLASTHVQTDGSTSALQQA